MDFLPLTCAVIGLCVAVFSFLSVSLEAPSMQVVDALDNVAIETTLKPAPSKTKPSMAAVPQVDQPAQGSAPSTGPSGAATPEPSDQTPSNTTPPASSAPSSGSGGSSGGGGTTVVGVGLVSGSGGGGTGSGGTGDGSEPGDGSVFGAGDGLTPDAEDTETGGGTGGASGGANTVAEQPATLNVGARS